MHRILLVCSLLGVAAMVKPLHAQGFLDWRWSFDQANFIVGPSDSILLTGTIFVRPESPAPFIGRVSPTFQGSLFALYDFDCGFCSDTRLSDVNIPPGGSLQFTFGTLTPLSPIAPGTYRNMPDQPLLLFDAYATHRTSDTPLVIQVIPEPSTLVFGSLGFLFLSVTWLLKRAASTGTCEKAAKL